MKFTLYTWVNIEFKLVKFKENIIKSEIRIL